MQKLQLNNSLRLFLHDAVGQHHIQEYSVLKVTPLDLHVLGTPPAFVLSQDQTLKLKFICFADNSATQLTYLISLLAH